MIRDIFRKINFATIFSRLLPLDLSGAIISWLTLTYIVNCPGTDNFELFVMGLMLGVNVYKVFF